MFLAACRFETEIRWSVVFVQVASDKFASDWRALLQFAMAAHLGKPIVVAQRFGVDVPEKVRMIADEIIAQKQDEPDEDFIRRLAREISRFTKRPSS